MIQVRRGVFETNSSSTHSIVICRQDTPQTFDRVTFSIGEYGWGHELLATPDERASYFYTLACALLCRDVADEIWDMLGKYGIDCEFDIRPVFSKGDWKYLENGYVDHCSDDDAPSFVAAMLRSAKRMIDFIFNPKSVVALSNDNSDNDPKYDLRPEDYGREYEFYYKGN